MLGASTVARRIGLYGAPNSREDSAAILHAVLDRSCGDGAPQMSENRALSYAQVMLWIALASLLIAGILLSIIADNWLGWAWAWVPHVAKDLGAGLITAALLGFTVDVFFKREFARDAFQAAFRYVLPEKMRQEAARIIGYKFICQRHYTVVAITEVGDDLVKVQIRTEREIENISRHTEPMDAMLALDDWGFDGYQPTIEACTVEIDGQSLEAKEENETRETDRVERKIPTRIEIKPGHAVVIVTKGHEFHRKNSQIFMWFGAPTVDPRIKIDAPEGFNFKCSFSVPGEKVDISKVDNVYRLNGTQFPGQHTRVRWWPKTSP